MRGAMFLAQRRLSASSSSVFCAASSRSSGSLPNRTIWRTLRSMSVVPRSPRSTPSFPFRANGNIPRRLRQFSSKGDSDGKPRPDSSGVQVQHPLRRTPSRSSGLSNLSTQEEERLLALLEDPEVARLVRGKLSKTTQLQFVAEWCDADMDEHFRQADLDRDGKISLAEFKRYTQDLCQRSRQQQAEASEEPSVTQLRQLFVQQLPPFIGFGLCDNTLMILSGDYIDQTIGLGLGLSTLGAAAVGNAFANSVGMGAHGAIERLAVALGLPDPGLTPAQKSKQSVTTAKTAGRIAGIWVGCLLGMWPLAFQRERGGGGEQ